MGAAHADVLRPRPTGRGTVVDALGPPGPPGSPADRRGLLTPFTPQKPQSDLADVLERVLDTGVVLVGDVGLVINGTEILSLRVRLLVASIDKSEEIGLDWWRHEPAFSSLAKKRQKRGLRKPPARPRLARRAREGAAGGDPGGGTAP